MKEVLTINKIDQYSIQDLYNICDYMTSDSLLDVSLSIHLDSTISEPFFCMLEPITMLKSVGTYYNVEIYAEGILDMNATILLSAGTNGFRKAKKGTTFTLRSLHEPYNQDVIYAVPQDDLHLLMSRPEYANLNFARYTTGGLKPLLKAYSRYSTFGIDVAMVCGIIDGMF